MTRQDPFDERLAAQAGWLRALARRLIRDEAGADDAVQDTILLAARGGPAASEPMPVVRAWLARTLRRRASHARRAAASRRGRESRAARPEATDDETTRSLERAESSQRLMETVMELSADARSVLLLRYFEGNSPAQMARDLGVSPEAVRSRLARARAELRDRLERRSGRDRNEWLAALLPAAGWNLNTGTTATGVAVLAVGATMKTKAMMVGAAAVLVLIGVRLAIPAAVPTAEPGLVRPDEEAAALTLAEPAADPIVERSAIESTRVPEFAAVAPDPELGAWLSIESSMGFPIEALQWRNEDGEWAEVAGPRVPRAATRVRAAGHSAVDVDPLVAVQSIEPDAVLTLRADALGEGAVDFEQGSLLRPRFGAALWFAPSADELAAVVDTERWLQLQTDWTAKFHVNLRAGAMLRFEWVPKTGDRITRDVELAPEWNDQELAPLILRGTGQGASATVDQQAAARLIGEYGGGVLCRETDLLVQVQTRFRRWEANGPGGAIEVGRLPVGELVTATLQLADGHYGSLTFTHLGPEVTVPLHQPVRIRGNLVDPRGAPVPSARAYLRFPYRDDEGRRVNDIAWSSDNAPVDPALGTFDWLMPLQIPMLQPDPASKRALPSPVLLRVDAPGFTRLDRWIDLSPGSTIDLGAVPLTDRAPDLVIDNGDLIPDTESFEVSFLKSDGRSRGIVVERTTRRAGGAMEAFLERGQLDPDSQHEQILLWAGDAGIFLLQQEGDAGHYMAIEPVQVKCTIDLSRLDPDVTGVTMLVSVHGLQMGVAAGGEGYMERGRIEFEARLPRENAHLMWVERRGWKRAEPRLIGLVATLPSRVTLEPQ